MSLERFDLIELPAGGLATNRSEFAQYGEDFNLFFSNAKSLSIKTIYYWRPGNKTTYCFRDANGIYHIATIMGGWESPEEKLDANKKGFNNPIEYRQSLEAGMKTKKIYDEVRASGFSSIKELKKMKKLGFNNRREYNKANGVGCGTLAEFDELIESGFPNTETRDRASKLGISNLGPFILVSAIKDLPKSLPIPLNIISEKFENKKREFLTEVEMQNSEVQGQTRTDIINLRFTAEMFKEKAVKKLGRYEESLKHFYRGVTGDFGKVGKIDVTKAVLDGNNIALHPELSSPMVSQIELVADKLKEKTVETTVFISQNMRSRNDWDNKKRLETLIRSSVIIVAPEDQEDDYWWIELALAQNSPIITNDKLRDWRARNPAKAKDLNERRVRFGIVKGNALLGPPFGELKAAG